ncbi:hypothetical protein FVE85_8714 [Porphyridium purpureum]|uniref:Uncharacterized protein n=1 Tax=Porphyridium purpureum TaxID=35688 RepID=A0A5J4YPA1_PORPP|nr:hypothetical protein FVE85_8714 [Porphyridium purpureum]|eukprot:POR7468..scf296_7
MHASSSFENDRPNARVLRATSCTVSLPQKGERQIQPAELGLLCCNDQPTSKPAQEIDSVRNCSDRHTVLRGQAARVGMKHAIEAPDFRHGSRSTHRSAYMRRRTFASSSWSRVRHGSPSTSTTQLSSFEPSLALAPRPTSRASMPLASALTGVSRGGSSGKFDGARDGAGAVSGVAASALASTQAASESAQRSGLLFFSHLRGGRGEGGCRGNDSEWLTPTRLPMH